MQEEGQYISQEEQHILQLQTICHYQAGSRDDDNQLDLFNEVTDPEQLPILLDVIWNECDTADRIRMLMDRWPWTYAVLPNLRPQRFASIEKRELLYYMHANMITGDAPMLHAQFGHTIIHALHLFFTPATSNYGRLLLLNIPDANVIDLLYNDLTPIQYAFITFENTEAHPEEAIQLLLDGGANIFDLAYVVLDEPWVLAERYLNEAALRASRDTDSFARLPQKFIISIVESPTGIQRILHGGLFSNLRGDRMQQVPAWQTSFPTWLNQYLYAKFHQPYEERRLPHTTHVLFAIPNLFTQEAMQYLWENASAYMFIDHGNNLHHVEFLEDCMSAIPHAGALLELVIRSKNNVADGNLVELDESIHPMLYRYVGYTDENEVLKTMQTIHRPERLTWLLYYRVLRRIDEAVVAALIEHRLYANDMQWLCGQIMRIWLYRSGNEEDGPIITLITNPDIRRWARQCRLQPIE